MMPPANIHARYGLALLIALWGVLGLIEFARASEVPPLIGQVRRLIGDTRRRLDGQAPESRKDALPGDGGMCSMPLVPDALDDIPERAEVERVLASCSRANRRSDPWAVLTVLRLEHDMGVPFGTALGAACWETGFTLGRRGDWLDGVARAHGPFQLHEQFETACGLKRGGRDDVDASARCWISRVVIHATEALSCPDPWRVGEAMTARGGEWMGCDVASAHAAELARWGMR